MKKSLLILLLLTLIRAVTIAQERTITGTVLSAEDGSVLPAANVLIKGTQRGVVTDAKGAFSIQANAKDMLVFSFVGFLPTEVLVGNQSIINLTLKPDAMQLQEVVVVALGLSREKRSVNTSVQEIKSDKLTAARDVSVAGALAGKIAGVQVLGQSGAKFGTPSIRIRGVNSLSGSGPLYVVDGTPTADLGINMDDVDNVSVLKGPAATALYGNRAAGGVLMITTKRAKAGETRVDINHSTTMDRVGLLPKYQNEYGGGYSQDWEIFQFNPAIHPAAWTSFNGHKMLDYSADESWGPRLDGTPHRSAFSWQPGAEFGQLTPFEPNPNNVREFFEKPLSHNTNVSFSKGGDNYQTRISYTHVLNNGIVPNSSQTRDFVSAKNSLNIFKGLTADLNINYAATNFNNPPLDGYGNQTIGSFNQWFQRQLKMDDLRNYRNSDGTYRSWNIGGPLDVRPKYWDSPFTEVYANTFFRRSTNVFGDFGLGYKFDPFLKLNLTLRRNQSTNTSEGRVASGTLGEGGKGGYSNSASSAYENNYEALLSYNRNFDKLSIQATAGGNIRYNFSESFSQATVGGLTSPGFYNIAASKDRPSVTNSKSERRINSVFGGINLGYKNTFFLEGTLRNDWSSTLPQANNSYLYPSLSGSIVFSDLLPQNNILSYGKIRGGYAQVGTDVGPYSTLLTYTTGNSFGTNPVMTLPTTLPNQNLKPGLSSSYEGGLDLKFFRNRVGLEFSVYQNDNKNQIIPLPVAPTSGYTNAVINAGLIQTKGWEVHINATPVKKTKFQWETDLNFDRSVSKVIKLADGLTNYTLGTSWRDLSINAREGEEWGLFVGRQIRKNEAGEPILNANGLYQSDINKPLGSVLPKFKGGFLNNFTYGNWNVRINTDFIVGGKFFSVTKMFNAYAGLGDFTAGLNELGNPKRHPVADGGGILIAGVGSDGKTPNTTRAETQALYEDNLFALHEYWIYDQTFIKLREVSIGYTFPKAMLGKSIKSANLSFIARNPFLIYSAVGGGIDISESESYWTEGGQLPPVRSLGINLRLSF
jgi:TonB-linked SusC/RagA family outer membrane protein